MEKEEKHVKDGGAASLELDRKIMKELKKVSDEDWEEIDNNYKEKILGRFRIDTENRNAFTVELNKLISRMYRLDSTIMSIVPGKFNEHINEVDFTEEAPKKQYLFHKIRPHGIQFKPNEVD